MKVGIQNKEGRLILVWKDGKRRTIAIERPGISPARTLAGKTKAEIENRTCTSHLLHQTIRGLGNLVDTVPANR